MALQIKRTNASGVQHLKVLVCGQSGAGKTLFGSTWPDPFYVSAEGGMLSLQGKGIPFVEIEDSHDIEQLLMALDQEPQVREQLLGKLIGEKTLPVQTVIVDTFDEIQRKLAAERNLEKRQETLTMQDWGWLGDQCRSLTRSFRNLPLNVIFTCHIKDDRDEQSGRIFVKPQLQGAFASEIQAYFDLALLVTSHVKTSVQGNQATQQAVRVLQTYPDAQHDWIKDRSGKLPSEVELNFSDDYTRIAGRIFGSLPAAPQAAPTPPPAPPAEGAAELASVVKNGPGKGAEEKPAEKKAEPTKRAAAKKAAPKAEAEPKATEKVENAPEPQPEPAPEQSSETNEPAPAPAEQADAASPQPAGVPSSGTADTETDITVCAECEKPIGDVDDDLLAIHKLLKKRVCRTCAATCEQCGNQVEDLQRIEMALIRWRKRLCPADFKTAGERKAS